MVAFKQASSLERSVNGERPRELVRRLRLCSCWRLIIEMDTLRIRQSRHESVPVINVTSLFLLPNWTLTDASSLYWSIDVDTLVYERQKRFDFPNQFVWLINMSACGMFLALITMNLSTLRILANPAGMRTENIIAQILKLRTERWTRRCSYVNKQ